VPNTIGNICDLQEFFCGRQHTRAIARKELRRCNDLHIN
jgi:hypothetical protein